MSEFRATRMPEPLASVVHAASEVNAARDAVAAAEVFRDLMVDAALAAGFDPAEVRALGGLT